MTKVMVSAEVENIERWKTGFATHSELFKKQAVTVAYYGAGEKNKGVACFETEDLNAFMEILESSDTAEAMSHDGIIDGTVEIFVLDSSICTLFDFLDRQLENQLENYYWFLSSKKYARC